jgi:hypothetical protein
MKNVLWLIIIIFTVSCTKNTKQPEQENQVVGSEAIKATDTSKDTPIMSLSDWLTETDWALEDGRYLVDPSIEQIDWIGDKTPIVRFQKLILPQESILYHVRLRYELFYFLYQKEEKEKLFPVGTTFGIEINDLKYSDDYSTMTFIRNGAPSGLRQRASEEINMEYPLVGIWGNLPALTEYRLIDPENSEYYFDIDKNIPEWAVREGTYLLKQTGDKVFETVTSFDDGHLKLEILNDKLILLTPLFTLPDGEKGFVAPLAIRRLSFRVEKEEDWY